MADQRNPFFAVDIDTGAGSELAQGVNLRISGSGASIEAKGQQTMANSIPVVLGSDHSNVPVDIAAQTLSPLVADVAGTTASDAPITSDPVTTGGRASDAVPTAVTTDGDVVNAWYSREGAARVTLTDETGDLLVFTGGTAVPIDIAQSNATVTVDLGANNDVTTELAGSTAVATMADNDANPDVLPMGAYLMAFDGTTWDRVRGTSTTGIEVDIVQSVGLTVDLGANNDVTTEFAGSTAVAAMADADANPSVLPVGAYLMGFDGTNWDRVYTVADGDTVAAATKGFLQIGSDGTNYQAITTDAAGHLQVDVLSGGGSPPVPTNPVNNYQTSASLAAGSSVDLTTPEATSKKLSWIEVWSSVAYKAFVHTVDNAVESTDPVMVGGGPAYHPTVFRPEHIDYITLGATAGLDAFRVKFTNLDDNLAADVYATFHYED